MHQSTNNAKLIKHNHKDSTQIISLPSLRK